MSMDEDQLNDLKQFITATVSQATADIATKEDIADMATKEDISHMAKDIAHLEKKMDDGFAGISEAIEHIKQINQTMDDRDKEVDQRFTNLEQQSA